MIQHHNQTTRLLQFNIVRRSTRLLQLSIVSQSTRLLQLSIVSFAMYAAIYVCGTSQASGETYTAVRSGAWDGDSTWGGVAPPNHLAADTVLIPLGIAVRMSHELYINHAEALLLVGGALTTTSESLYTEFGLGKLEGTGSTSFGHLRLTSNSKIHFAGNLRTFTLGVGSYSYYSELQDSGDVHLSTHVVVLRTLELRRGTLVVDSGGKIELWVGSKIAVSDGDLDTNGGVLAFEKSHYVSYGYTGKPRTLGLELSGYPRQGFIVDGARIVLKENLDVEKIILTRGALDLNGFDLNVGYLGRSDYYQCELITTALSSITIGRTTTRAIEFRVPSNVVKNLTVSNLASDTVFLSGGLNVMGTLNIKAGTLSMGWATLTLHGPVEGQGAIRGDTNFNLVVRTPEGLPQGLRFSSGGQFVKSLTIDLGTTNSVKLLSDLSVWGATAVTSGNLDMRDVGLVLGGSYTGDGDLLVNKRSRLSVKTSHGFENPLRIRGDSLGVFKLELPRGEGLKLGHHLIVVDTLALTKGTLILNSMNLTVLGKSKFDSGDVHSTAASSITFRQSNITSNSNVFSFTSAGNVVGSLIVDGNKGQSLVINGGLEVKDLLQLKSGDLNMSGDAPLTLHCAIEGPGKIGGSITKLTIDRVGGYPKGLNCSASMGELELNVGTDNIVKFNNTFAVSTLRFISGDLGIENSRLILKGAIVGHGSIFVNDSSWLELQSKQGLLQPLPIVGEIGTLVIDADSNRTIKLGSNLVVHKNLSIKSGTFVLNGYDLASYGSIQSEKGDISSSGSSSVYIGGNQRGKHDLAFAPFGNHVDNLTVDISSDIDPAAAVTLYTELEIEGTLTLLSGYLSVPNHVLRVQNSGSIVGASTSRYIRTLFGGAIEMTVSPGIPAIYPLGCAVSYLPCEITTSSESKAEQVTVGIRSTWSQKYAQSPIWNSRESVSWLLTSNTNTLNDFDLSLGWHKEAEKVGFDRSQAYIAKLEGLKWDADVSTGVTVTDDTVFSVRRRGVKGLGRFAIFADGVSSSAEEQVEVTAGPISGLDVYPTPASDAVSIAWKANNEVPFVLDILDMQGRVVLRPNIEGPNHKVSILELCAGVYYVRLHASGTTITKRFVKL